MEYRDSINDSNGYYVKSASRILSTMGFGETKSKQRHADREKEHDRPRKKVKKFFPTLAKAAESSNEQLEQKNIPFRFCVYEKDGNVFIEFVQLDHNGKVKTSNTKDITNEDFNQWIEDIANIEGLVIDTIG